MTFSAPKRSRAERGYGQEHVKARAAAAATHHPLHPCSRCKQPLGPMGPWLHYDHDGTRTGYLGFAHARCNTSAGARRGAIVANARRKATRQGFTRPRW